MDVEEVLLEGDEVIQEIRWHSESPSPSGTCSPWKTRCSYVNKYI